MTNDSCYYDARAFNGQNIAQKIEKSNPSTIEMESGHFAILPSLKESVECNREAGVEEFI